MSCPKCTSLNYQALIRSPGELAKFIRLVRNHVISGGLAEIEQETINPKGSIQDLPEEGPWPDYVKYHFRCTSCGYRYRLEVETYHGSGGCWSPLSTAE